MNRLLAASSAVAVLLLLASAGTRSSGVERLSLDDVKSLRGGYCMTLRAQEVSAIKSGPGYWAFSKTTVIQCLRMDFIGSIFFVCNSGTITQTQMTTGVTQCSVDPNYPSASINLTSWSGPIGSFNVTRVIGGFCYTTTGC